MTIAPSASALTQGSSKPRLFHAAANLIKGREPGALMVDGMGRIRGSGASAENLFGPGRIRLIGRRISEFIGGLFPEGSSPSHNARYLAYLSADGEWRKFVAKDVGGKEFAVEISLSRRMTEGQEVFVLNVRQVDAASIR